MRGSWAVPYERKLLLPEEVEKSVARFRGDGKTIATLNGCFDILHVGHLCILETASRQADLLIVALNGDAHVTRYKGQGRPIASLRERLLLMAALACVDRVTYFDEPDPRLLLAKIRPDVHVNGSEYGEECIEADVVKTHGGRVHLVSPLSAYSTTGMIEKIRATPCVYSD